MVDDAMIDLIASRIDLAFRGGRLPSSTGEAQINHSKRQIKRATARRISRERQCLPLPPIWARPPWISSCLTLALIALVWFTRRQRSAAAHGAADQLTYDVKNARDVRATCMDYTAVPACI